MDDAAKRRLLEIIPKIPPFRDLTLYQAEKILQICRFKRYEVDQVICEHGATSTEMFILLSGELTVHRGDSLIATITPVVSVGEMGVLTGMPRTATVIAIVSSSLLSIQLTDFESLTKQDPDIVIRLLKDFSRTLSRRLTDSEETFDQQRHELQEYRRQATEYRRRIELLEQRVAELIQHLEINEQRIQEMQYERMATELPVE
ncbi:MAG: cyclic nucleotide-binding domain-containing protein [Candidatus Latescibacteria bacterium]|nr:cyclic nucleotide-binding domain-containing protein [Candidatus Latescibacterota bacterium]